MAIVIVTAIIIMTVIVITMVIAILTAIPPVITSGCHRSDSYGRFLENPAKNRQALDIAIGIVFFEGSRIQPQPHGTND
jgi:hypothetical protein